MLLKLLNRKMNLVALILLVHLTLSYYYIPRYWASAAGFLLIVFISWLTWKHKFVFRIGVKLSFKEMVIAVLAILIFMGASVFLIKTIDQQHNLEFSAGNYKSFLHTFFYTLNEEIVLGALLLKGIQFRWKKLAFWQISVAVALCFTFIHFIFFKWIFLNSGNLTPITILSLLAIGILRNNLILSTGHIGYSWAIHFGWVFPMLGCTHFNKNTGHILTDFESFMFYPGDIRILSIVAILATGSFFLFSRKVTFS